MLQYLAVLIIASLSLTILGWGIAYLLKLTKGINSVSELLLAYVLGLYSTTITYSLIKTSFSTINVTSLIILLVAYYYSSKISRYTRPKFSFKSALLPFVVFIGLFCVTNSYLVESGDMELHHMNSDDYYLNSDHHFSTNISYYMNLTGEENEFHALNLISSDYQGMTPYHYSELWLNAVIAELFGLNYDVTLSWVINALFFFMVFLAFLVLYQTITGKLDIWGWLLSAGTLFFFGSATPISWLGSLGIPFLENLKDINLLSSLKSAPYQLFITLFLIFWHREKRILAYLSLMFMSIVQFTSIPAVFGFLLLWSSYYTFYKNRKEEKIILVWLIILSILFIAQKSLWGNQHIAREGTSFNELLAAFMNLSQYAVQRVGILVKEVIYLLLRYHFIWLILFIGWRRRSYFIEIKQEPLLVLFGISSIGLLTYVLLFQIVNSDQLYGLIINAWIPIFFLFMLINMIKDNPPLKNYLSIAFIIFMSLNIHERVGSLNEPEIVDSKYSKEYLDRIHFFIKNDKNTNAIGASFRDDYVSEYASYVTIYTLGSYLSQFKNGACTISLSDLEIPIHEDPLYQKRSENGYKLGWLYRRVKEQKANGTFISYEDTQLKLLKEGDFQYAIFSKNYKIPEIINDHIQEIHKDRKSGEKFAILKTE